MTIKNAGSLKEIWRITYPLLLIAMSTNLMLFADRFILANYSAQAMNSTAAGGVYASSVILAFLEIVVIAEIFVGQYKGSGKDHKVAIPVWQMIWFSAAAIVIMWPIAFYGAELLIPKQFAQEGIPYFRWILLFGPFTPLLGALSTFFVGRSQPLIVTAIAAFGNIVNIGLDYLLVFGYKDLIPELGSTGAAVATGISQALQFLILLWVFLLPKYREKYNTHKWNFNWDEMKACIKYGVPPSIAIVLEYQAWAILFHFVDDLKPEHVAILVIGETLVLFFDFLGDAMNRGVEVIAATYIGAQKMWAIPQILKSSTVLHVAIIAIALLPIIFTPDWIISMFIPESTANFDQSELLRLGKIGLFFVWLYISLDGFVWIISGILTAGGDTRFVAIANGITPWLFGVLPIYIALKHMMAPGEFMWYLVAFYASILLSLMFMRYKFGNWLKLKLFEDKA